jgi:hypothetical protein
MSRIRKALCLAVAIYPVAAVAGTIVTGVPNLVQVPGANGPCATFQVGTLTQTFAVPTTDINFGDESRLLNVALLRGLQITLTDAGATVSSCQNYELAQNILLGGLTCAQNAAADFANACNAVDIVFVGGF